jgi:hypothetical protein
MQLIKCAATSRSPGSSLRIDDLGMLKRHFRRSSCGQLLFWRQQAIILRATHSSVVSPLAAVSLAVLAAASSPGSLATFAAIHLASSQRWQIQGAAERKRIAA